MGAVVPGRVRVRAAARSTGCGRIRPVRFTQDEAATRREANERGWSACCGGFASLELDPVLLSSADPVGILDSFLCWHGGRHDRLRQPVRLADCRSDLLRSRDVCRPLGAAFASRSCTGPRRRPCASPGGPCRSSRTLTPGDLQFGDTVTATLDVYADTRRVESGSVRVDGPASPRTTRLAGPANRRARAAPSSRHLGRSCGVSRRLPTAWERPRLRFGRWRRRSSTARRGCRRRFASCGRRCRCTPCHRRRPAASRLRVGRPTPAATGYRLPPNRPARRCW